MSAHAKAIRASREMCDRLHKRLAEQIPDLAREYTQQWCALFEPRRNRFAYVSHRLTDDIIEVWCSGDVDKLRACKGIDVRPRNRIRDKGWEKQFPARFEVYNDETLAAAVRCLLSVSYPAS